MPVPGNSCVHFTSRGIADEAFAAWLGAVVLIGPLMGSVVAKTIAIVARSFRTSNSKMIRYLRRTLSDLGTHKGLAPDLSQYRLPCFQRFSRGLR